MNKKLVNYLILGQTLIYICLLIFIAGLQKHQLKQLVSPLGSSEITNKPSSQTLNAIVIPTIHLSLPIKTAIIKNDEWVLYDVHAAFYGQGSAFPGSQGTTAIFAHARNGLFANLPLVQVGDDVIIFSDQTIFYYKITNRQIVSPDDISILQSSGQNQLRLLTCYGGNDVSRIVLSGSLYRTSSLDQFYKNIYSSWRYS